MEKNNIIPIDENAMEGKPNVYGHIVAAAIIISCFIVF